MTQIILNKACVIAAIRQIIPAGMTQHVWMNVQRQGGTLAILAYQLIETLT